MLDLAVYNGVGLLAVSLLAIKSEGQFRVTELILDNLFIELEAVGVNGELHDLLCITEVAHIQG